MGLIDRIFGFAFGNGRNLIRDTAEVFRENAEAGAGREAALQQAALAQFGQEFTLVQRSRFDCLMDGINRLPRPSLAFGTLGLFIAAMVDPVWFSARMQGIALVPEPLWWLLGAIVSFYFGARHQAKGQEFQSRVVDTLRHVPAVVGNLRRLEELGDDDMPAPPGQLRAPRAAKTANPALIDWRARHAPQMDQRSDER